MEVSSIDQERLGLPGQGDGDGDREKWIDLYILRVQQTGRELDHGLWGKGKAQG